MVSGWRRTFCTSKSVPENRELTSPSHQQQQQHYEYDKTNQSSELSSDFTFFSTPSIPQSESPPISSPILRYRTSVPKSSVSNSPKHHCNGARTPSPNKSNSPMSFHPSTPPSPNSPSTSSFLKATFGLSKNLCGICTQKTGGLKNGEGKAIFTAECSHSFHFPCIAAHVKKHQMLTCPVCSTNWKTLQPADENKAQELKLKTTKLLKLHTYNDDEPLMSPTSVSRFNPIPESSENEEEEEEQNEEETGFNVLSSFKIRNVDICFLQEAAIVATNWRSENYVAVLKVKAHNAGGNRPPLDLVTVLDIGGAVSGEELRMLKHSMQVVISSLGSVDRLSVVAFAGGSKRLFPLRRMTGRGQTAVRRIVDALAAIEFRRDGTPGRNVALRKAAKVLEDRRQKNSVAKIILFSNGHEDHRLSSSIHFPVHCLRYSRDSGCGYAQQDSDFAKHVESLLSVVTQDLRLELKTASRSIHAEVAAVYSMSNPCTAALSPESAVIGDMYAGEERELMVELKVPTGTASRGSHHHFISVRSSYRDPFTQELVHSKEREFVIPRPHAVRSSNPLVERLKHCHVIGRAVAESRRLVAHNDLSGALRFLTSARASAMQLSDEECLRWLEAERAELRSQKKLQSNNNCMEEKVEPLSPMSAWRVAEKLAKVAIMRKSMNRVSDLHGFEDARF